MNKSILTITLLIGHCFGIFGQSANELSIDSIPQRGLYFCWASTMEMIMKYRPVVGAAPTKTQCELAFEFSRSFPTSYRPKLSCCRALCIGDCDAEQGECDKCDQPLPYRTKLAGVSESEKLFLSSGFTAEEKMNDGANLISFNEIKSQIDANKPMAIVFTVSNADISGAHFTVLKGYKEEPGREQFVSIFDPWKPCIGGTILVNYIVFTTVVGGSYKWALSYIKNIQRNLMIARPRAMMAAQILDTMTLTKGTQSLYVHGVTKSIKQSEFDQLKIKIPLKYISPNDVSYLSNDTTAPCNQKYTIADVTQTIDSSSVMTTMQFLRDKWVPIEIRQYDYPTSLSVKVGNDLVALSNQGRGSNIHCFERVVISGMHYEFYRFIYGGKPYVVPIGQTSGLLIGGKKVYQYNAYTASSMVKSLKLILPNRPQFVTTQSSRLKE